MVQQGPLRNTCLAVAATGGHEFLRGELRLSIEHLWENARARQGVSPRGATMTSIRDGLVTDGQCEEASWPYGPVTPLPRPASLGSIYQAQQGDILPPDLDVLKRSIEDGRALVIGLSITDSFMTPTVVPIDIVISDPVLQGHAVLAVGYDDAATTVRIKNSWGTGWGSGGYAEITYAYFNSRCLRMLRLSL